MKKDREADTLRDEYDFTGGVRGKYAARLREGVSLVQLDPDVAERFPTSEAVNRALRSLLTSPSAARRRSRPPR